MTNLDTQTPQIKPNSDAAYVLRRELFELSWAIGVQSEILGRYLELGQDGMAFHSVRQMRASFEAVEAIARQLHELTRQELGS